jgi:imidazolonepropionase-like amidohydrolase
MVVPRLRDALRRVPLPAPRIQAAGPAITTPRGHLNYLGAVAETIDEVRAFAERLLEEGADLIKICATGGVMTAESDPMLCQYEVDALRGAVATAAARDAIVAAHVLSAEGVRRCVEAGVRSLEHCLLQTTPGEYAFDPELAERMRRDGLFAGFTFAGIGQARYRETVLGRHSAEDMGAWRGRMERRYATERQLIAAGIPYVLHSDAGVRETPFGEFWLIPTCAALELGLPPLEAIRACTQSAARLMGLEDRLGTVAPGKTADLLLVDGDPSRDLACLARVRRVFRSGHVVAEDGRLLGMTNRD